MWFLVRVQSNRVETVGTTGTKGQKKAANRPVGGNGGKGKGKDRVVITEVAGTAAEAESVFLGSLCTEYPDLDRVRHALGKRCEESKSATSTRRGVLGSSAPRK